VKPGDLPAPEGLLGLPGVLGVGFGLKEVAGRATSAMAWRVYVRRKLPASEVTAAERIPSRVDGFVTDVLEKGPTSPAALSPVAVEVGAGDRLANSRGVPGTLGGLAVTRGGANVFLSAHHVLFGLGGIEGESVWSVEQAHGVPRFRLLGQTLRGYWGVVRHADHEVFVDCAIGQIGGEVSSRSDAHADGIAAPRAGARVSKVGSATRVTEGIVVDVSYPDVAHCWGRAHQAPGQILVQGLSSEGSPPAFSAEGDSGSLLINEENKAIGLLWGVTQRGEGVASPIAAVLQTLEVELWQPAEVGQRDRRVR
jgi:hypothetical protein